MDTKDVESQLLALGLIYGYLFSSFHVCKGIHHFLTVEKINPFVTFLRTQTL